MAAATGDGGAWVFPLADARTRLTLVQHVMRKRLPGTGGDAAGGKGLPASSATPGLATALHTAPLDERVFGLCLSPALPPLAALVPGQPLTEQGKAYLPRHAALRVRLAHVDRAVALGVPHTATLALVQGSCEVPKPASPCYVIALSTHGNGTVRLSLLDASAEFNRRRCEHTALEALTGALAYSTAAGRFAPPHASRGRAGSTPRQPASRLESNMTARAHRSGDAAAAGALVGGRRKPAPQRRRKRRGSDEESSEEEELTTEEEEEAEADETSDEVEGDDDGDQDEDDEEDDMVEDDGFNRRKRKNAHSFAALTKLAGKAAARSKASPGGRKGTTPASSSKGTAKGKGSTRPIDEDSASEGSDEDSGSGAEMSLSAALEILGYAPGTAVPAASEAAALSASTAEAAATAKAVAAQYKGKRGRPSHAQRAALEAEESTAEKAAAAARLLHAVTGSAAAIVGPALSMTAILAEKAFDAAPAAGALPAATWTAGVGSGGVASAMIKAVDDAAGDDGGIMEIDE
jgi:hypothetical protein